MRITDLAQIGSGLTLAAALFGAACGGKSTTPPCSPGAERCDCRSDGTCADGLVCVASNVCVRIGGTDTGAGGAGGSPGTGGVTNDGGGMPTGTGGGMTGGGGVIYTGAGGSRIPPDAGPPSARRVDALFMVDNSSSMADKQAILAAVVGDLVNRLVNPACVDPTTGVVIGQRQADGTCANGQVDFDPVNDL